MTSTKRVVVEYWDEVARWFDDEHLTPTEVAARYRDKYAVQFTPEAFTGGYKRRFGVSPVQHRNGRTRHIPWDLPDEHRSMYRPSVLRDVDRRERGFELNRGDALNIAKLRRDLHEQDAVIDYQPDEPDVFPFVPRQPGDGEWSRPLGASPHT